MTMLLLHTRYDVPSEAAPLVAEPFVQTAAPARELGVLAQHPPDGACAHQHAVGHHHEYVPEAVVHPRPCLAEEHVERHIRRRGPALPDIPRQRHDATPEDEEPEEKPAPHFLRAWPSDISS